jgi:6-phosphogluconolactonase (cycloisomerase 2 family)
MIFQKHSVGAISPVCAAVGAAAILLVACLPVLTGCGSGKFFIPVCQETNSCGGGGGTNSSYAYVGNSVADSLAVFPLPTAAFTSISGTTYPLGAQPTAMAATPNGSLLYVATTLGQVVVYTVANGVPTLGNGGSAVVSTITPAWIAIDPTGNWLFLISSSISALLEYQINPTTGVLTLVGPSTGTALTSGGTPTQVYVAPNDQTVYVSSQFAGVDAFAFSSSTGALASQAHISSKGGADNALGSDSKSAFLFVGEAGTGIRVFTTGGANGALTEVSGSPFQSQLGPNSIVVDPTNSYVYVANKTANVITGYTLATSGALTPLPSSPYSTGSGPTSLSLDSTGKYLLVICAGGSPDLQVFSFDTTTGGKLDSVASSSTATSTAGAISLSVVP